MIEEEYSNPYLILKPKKLTKAEKHKNRMARKKATKQKNKQKTQKYWIDKMDNIARNVCRSRGKCENPHCKFQSLNYVLQWAHVVSRSYHATRWDADNCLCLCSGCHKYYTDRPVEWEFLIEDMFGEGFLMKMKRRAFAKPKMTRVELEEKYNEMISNPLVYESFAQEAA